MKTFLAVIAVATFGVTGLCYADEVPSATASSEIPQNDRRDFAETLGAMEARLAQRAILYEEEPAEAEQPGGTVAWWSEWSAPTPGQKPDVVIRAEIAIPEQNVSVQLSLRHNADKRLPASHMVEIVFTLPPGFPHHGISEVSGILMKQGETMRAFALKSIAAKVRNNEFLVGLLPVDADMHRNVRLLKEQSWLEIALVYRDGKRAFIVVEKGPQGERAFADAFDAWSELEAGGRLRTVHTVPIDAAAGAAVGRNSAPPTPASARLRPQLNLPILVRPTWTWPPQNFWWASALGSRTAAWTWQFWSQPAPAETIRTASTVVLTPPPRPTPPSWLQSMSVVTTPATAAPSWPRAAVADFHIPTERSRFAGNRYLEPPPQYLRWSDRLETVLRDDRDVDRRCRAMGVTARRGIVIRGCTNSAAGRCFITRVDDPGVARHEMAHCAGWKHPQQ
jgi:hypothetical protein